MKLRTIFQNAVATAAAAAAFAVGENPQYAVVTANYACQRVLGPK